MLSTDPLIQIPEWDWHYRVGFDSELADKIRTTLVTALGFNNSTSELNELTAYEKLVSIDSLVTYSIENPFRFASYVEVAQQKQLLHLPLELHGVIDKRISSSSLPASHQIVLKQLCKSASNVKYVNHAKYLTELVLGADFIDTACDLLAAYCDGGSRPTDQQSSSNIDGILSILEEYKLELLEYGRSTLPLSFNLSPIWQTRADFSVDCYAEYWPSLLTNTVNTLVLGKGLLSASNRDILGTFVHEISGHAFFYDFVEKCPLQLIDHGATCLIEGWATWCEWNSPLCNSDYKLYLRLLALSYLKLVAVSDVDKAIEHLHRCSRMSRLSSAQISQSILYYFQYPCYSLSYYTGAAWFEMYKLNNDSVLDYWLKKKEGKLTNIL